VFSLAVLPERDSPVPVSPPKRLDRLPGLEYGS